MPIKDVSETFHRYLLAPDSANMDTKEWPQMPLHQFGLQEQSTIGTQNLFMALLLDTRRRVDRTETKQDEIIIQNEKILAILSGSTLSSDRTAKEPAESTTAPSENGNMQKDLQLDLATDTPMSSLRPTQDPQESLKTTSTPAALAYSDAAARTAELGRRVRGNLIKPLLLRSGKTLAEAAARNERLRMEMQERERNAEGGKAAKREALPTHTSMSRPLTSMPAGSPVVATAKNRRASNRLRPGIWRRLREADAVTPRANVGRTADPIRIGPSSQSRIQSTTKRALYINRDASDSDGPADMLAKRRRHR